MTRQAIYFKSRPKQRRFLLWFLLGALVIAVFISLFYILIYSDLFQVKKIEVKSNSFVSSDILASSVAAQIIGSFWQAALGPNNILFWEWSEKTEKKLASFPQLESTHIKSDFWKRQVTIISEARRIFVVLCKTTAHDCYGIDQAGYFFGRVPEFYGVLILKIEDENDRPLILGNPFLPKKEWLENLFSTLKILKEHSNPAILVRLKDLELEEWEAITASGLIFSFSLNFVPKALPQILENISPKLKQENLTYIDFRVPQRIYYK